MLNISNNIKIYHEFRADNTRSLFLRDDDQIATCNSAASMAGEIGTTTFTLIERIKFLWIDFIALIPYFRPMQFAILSEKIMPALIKKIETMNQFVSQHYDCPQKTVDFLEDAKIICFGETHTIDDHRRKNGTITEALMGTSISDVVLVEGTLGRIQKSDQTKYIKKPIAHTGWDNRDQNEFERLKNLKTRSVFAQYASLVLLAWNMCGLVEGERTYWNLCLPVCMVVLATIACRNNENRYDNLLKDTFLGSNQSMCRTIARNLGYRKVYVMSGSAHLRDMKSYHVQAVNELYDYLKPHKHIVLIPKERWFDLFRRVRIF